MDKKTVLVTGIGGNVAQGVLRNIRSLNLPIRLIGCDISDFTPGNHLCDQTYQVPYAYDKNYIQQISKIVTTEKIDLIIPTTDYEIYYLALEESSLSAFVLTSDSDVSKVCLDKYLTYLKFVELDIPFAKTWLAPEYDFSEKNCIAKPREGRGSRGVLIDPINIAELKNDYLIQKRHIGIEITTAVYVNKKGDIHGVFSMERKLEHGTTSQAIVNDAYNNEFLRIAKKILKLGKIRGPFNIQSIVNQSGEIFPFEINCRFSGTNSIRHCFGFKDVQYALQEYLYNEEPEEIVTTKGVANRILMDIIYPDAIDIHELNNNKSNHKIH